MAHETQSSGAVGTGTKDHVIVPSMIFWSVLIQIVFFLVVRAAHFFPGVDAANYFSLQTLGEFMNDITFGTLWIIVFDQWFKGQALVYALLTISPVVFIVRARGEGGRSVYLGLFHASAVVWTLLPALALRLGDYRGP